MKGATEGGDGWWVNYGFGTQEVIDGPNKMYNSVKSFYRAQVVVLVSVESASEYRCVVLPVEVAEKAAQLNLDHFYQNPKVDGSKKKPGKVWVSLECIPKPKDASRLPMLESEQEILRMHVNAWNFDEP